MCKVSIYVEYLCSIRKPIYAATKNKGIEIITLESWIKELLTKESIEIKGKGVR